MFELSCVACFQKNSLHALKKSLQAFRSAVHGALGTVDDSKTQTPLKFKVEGDTGKKVSYDNCVINF